MSKRTEGSYINDVTVSGEEGQGFCDDTTKALVIKSVMRGGDGQGGVKNYPKWRDVIYGRPRSVSAI